MKHFILTDKMFISPFNSFIKSASVILEKNTLEFHASMISRKTKILEDDLTSILEIQMV